MANQAANSLTVYSAAAGVNAAPLATIAGPATGLGSPDALTIDSAGRVWVANASSNSLTEYAADASGDATPRRHDRGFGYRVEITSRACAGRRG